MIDGTSILRNYPLSLNQQALFVDILLNPEGTNYDYCFSYEIKGNLNVFLFKKILYNAVQKRSAFYTSFSEKEGIPYQVIHETPEEVLHVIDAQALTQEEFCVLFNEKTTIHFGLNDYPLYKFFLIKRNENHFFFIMNFHHLIMDGECLEELLYELSSAYNNFTKYLSDTEGQKPLSIQDWLHYENSIDKKAFSKSVSFWNEYLKEAEYNYFLTPVCSNKRSHLPVIQSFSFQLSRTFSQDLKMFSKKTMRSTIFRVLLSSYYVLLNKYTREKDITICYPANIRPSQLKSLAGYYVGMQPLRIQIKKRDTFQEVLSEVNKSISLSKGMIPYVFTYKRQKLKYSNIYFGKANFLKFSLQLKDVSVSYINLEKPNSSMDLSFLYDDVGEHIEFKFNYNALKYDKKFIEKLCTHYKLLIEEVIHKYKDPVSSLKLLTKKEKHLILENWNNTQYDYPKEKQIHQLFEEQVHKSPDAIAAVFEGKELTYSDLNEKANQLAYLLREKGIKPDSLVALCVDRSLDLIIGLLGILKSGGAYVPLDPSYPQDRLEFMLEDTKSLVLITQKHYQEKFKNYKGEVIPLNEEWRKRTRKYQKDNPSLVGTSSNLAYVIYTSGSTGKPKGVLIEHQSVLNCSSAIIRAIGINSKDTFLAVTSLSFDVSVLDYFIPLLVGGRVTIVDHDARKDPVKLIEILLNNEITCMQATPTVWKMLADNGWQGHKNFKIMTAGEALSIDLSRSLHKRGDLYNIYGPTENTIYSTIYKIDQINVKSAVPIGKPIGNTQAYILDEAKNVVPVGVAGELYVGGDGLARRYLNRPELTQEKFVTNPFSQDTSSRLYKTGDLARYLLDGNIEYLGRIDEQVKIRGYRIELGEIESILNDHKLVDQAVVNAKEDDLGQKRLIAYIVKKKNQGEGRREGETIQELRKYLEGKLPDYMVPSVFVFIDAIPLTPSGKIDRKSLPESDLEQRALIDEYVSPETELEKKIASIWSKFLHIDKIGIHDNFFELGGNSLLATQIISRIRRLCQIELPLKDFFKAPTINEITKKFEKKDKKIQNFLPLIPRVREGNIPLSFAQQRLWFIDQFTPETPLYNIPLVLKLKGSLHQEALKKALQSILNRHEALRTIFKVNEGNPFQFIQDTLSINLSIVDLLSLTGEKKRDEAQNYIESEILKPFKLDEGPLIRAALIKLKKEEHLFVLTLHHIIGDGWSMGIIGQEISEIYNATWVCG